MKEKFENGLFKLFGLQREEFSQENFVWIYWKRQPTCERKITTRKILLSWVSKWLYDRNSHYIDWLCNLIHIFSFNKEDGIRSWVFFLFVEINKKERSKSHDCNRYKWHAHVAMYEYKWVSIKWEKNTNFRI